MSLASLSPRRLLPASLVISALTLVVPVGANAAPIRGNVAGGWTRLHGSVSPALRHAHRLQRVAGSRLVGITVTLKVRDQSGLDSFLQDLYDPASPSYHHFLTPQQFAQRFGPDAAERATVTSWLTGQGLDVVSTSSNGMQVTAQGSASTTQTAFDTPLYSFKAGSRDFFANTQPIRLPDAVASDVVAVSGLSNAAQQQPAPIAHLTSHALPGSGGLTPADLRSAYDLSPILSRGINGSGQTLAILGFADYDQSNIATYDSQYGITSTVSRIKVSDGRTSGAPLGDSNGQSESEMDIELTQAAAPGAAILMYAAPNTSQGNLRMYNKVVSDDQASVVTTSWGGEESTYTTNELNSMHQILEEGAAQGQAFFAASGDSGAYDGVGQPGGDTGLSVDYPASDPWVTGVGGTSLTENGGQYGSETAWSDNSELQGAVGSGGGVSSVFPRPSYQTGPGVSNSYSNGTRQVPDVALDADPATGYAIYTVNGRRGSQWGQAGGTSAAAPVWAGFDLLVNQALGRRLGPLNPTLYSLGAHASSLARAPFHDVTQGDNLYYPATPGWDFATGWGSFDGDALIADLAATPSLIATSVPPPTATATAMPSPTAAPSSVSISNVLLLHKVSGKTKTTSSLKVGESGTLIVLYRAVNPAQRQLSGTVSIRQNGKTVKTITLSPTTYNGKPAFSATVKFTSPTRVGTLQAHVTVKVGSLISALTYALKLVPAK